MANTSSSSSLNTSDCSTESSTDVSAESFLVVAAIDFGTAYSGYAFAFRSDPTQIETNVWKDQNLLSYKTTTSILFKKGEFHSFGIQADKKYANILEQVEAKEDEEEEDDDDDDDDDEDEEDREREANWNSRDEDKVKRRQEFEDEKELKNWRYFKRFKMQLYREFNQFDSDEPIGRHRKRKITREMTLKDDQGNAMAAFKIFSSAIRFLTDHLIKAIQKRVPTIVHTEICWVLTVPAIWTDAAKQFMREAAIEAGIPNDDLILALEPEAAAILCKQSVVQKTEDDDKNLLSAFLPGEKFLVLDMGGGTVDITISQVLENGKLKEIRTASGGPWGGTRVDEEYIRFMKDLFGEKVWNEFSHEHPSDRFDIECDFEIKKRNFEKEPEYMSIRCPSSLFDKYKLLVGTTLSKDLKCKGHKYKGTVKVIGDKLKIKTKFVFTLFEEPKNQIIRHLKNLFEETSMSSVSTILMVGGFSESEYMQSEIKREFENKRVIIPTEAGMAILKGAVTYGFDQTIICERRSPKTYGISVNVPFDDDEHPQWLKCVYDGMEKCTDIFQIMVIIGQPLIVNETVFEHVCRPTNARDNTANVEIYESMLEKPQYTSDSSSRRIGQLSLEIPDVERGKNRLIRIKMYFGNTEIFVSAHEEGTSNSVRARFNCL